MSKSTRGELTQAVAIRAFVAVAIILSLGCQPKLGKEEAKGLILLVAPKTPITCSLEAPDVRIAPFSPPGAKSVIYEDQEWAAKATSLGFISEPSCVQDKDSKCQAVQTSEPNCESNPTFESMKFATQRSYKRGCRLQKDCGEVSISIDSVSTEGRHAKIKYSIRTAVDPKFMARVSEQKAAAILKVTPESESVATAEAVRDDDGKWTIELKH